MHPGALSDARALVEHIKDQLRRTHAGAPGRINLSEAARAARARLGPALDAATADLARSTREGQS